MGIDEYHEQSFSGHMVIREMMRQDGLRAASTRFFVGNGKAQKLYETKNPPPNPIVLERRKKVG
jgi:hypothetical protein